MKTPTLSSNENVIVLTFPAPSSPIQPSLCNQTGQQPLSDAPARIAFTTTRPPDLDDVMTEKEKAELAQALQLNGGAILL